MIRVTARSLLALTSLVFLAGLGFGFHTLLTRNAQSLEVLTLTLATAAAVILRLRPEGCVLLGAIALIGGATAEASGASGLGQAFGDLAFFGFLTAALTVLAAPKPHVQPHLFSLRSSQSRYAGAWVFLATTLLALAPLAWFHSGQILDGNDTNYPLNALYGLRVRLSAWDWETGAGASNLAGLGTAPWWLLIYAFQRITGSYLVAQRVLLVVAFFAVPAAFLVLAKTLTRTWTFGLLVPMCVYALNPYFMNAWSNTLVATICGAIALPLLLALGVPLARRDNRLRGRDMLGWSGVSLLLAPVSASPQILAVIVTVVMVAIVALARPLAFRRISLLVAITLMVNAFWLLPQLVYLVRTPGLVSTHPLQVLGLTNWTSGVSAHTSLLNTLRFAGSWDWFSGWNGHPYVPYASEYLHEPVFVGLGCALVVAAFAAIAVRQTRLVAGIGLTALISVALSAGSHPPFGGGYDWVVSHIPLAGIFRSPWYKFGLLTALTYALLLTILVSELSTRTWTIRLPAFRVSRRRSTGLVALLLGLAGALTYGAPLLNGDVTLPHRLNPPGFRVHIPSYVSAAGRWLHEQGAGTRILWLPRRTEVYRFGFATGTETLIDYASDASVEAESPFSVGTAGDEGMVRELLNSLDAGRLSDFRRIASLLGLRFAVLRSDTIGDFYGPNAETPAFLRHSLRAAGLRLVRSFGPWSFFAFPGSSSPVRATSVAVSVPSDPAAVARAATFLNLGSAPTMISQADLPVDIRHDVAESVRPVSGATLIGGAPTEGFRYVHIKQLVRPVSISSSRRGMLVRQLPSSFSVAHHVVTIPGHVLAHVLVRGRAQPAVGFLVDGLATYFKTIYLPPGLHTITPLVVGHNLLHNGSFQHGIWTPPIDAGPAPGARAKVAGRQTARLVPDGAHDHHVLMLASTGDRSAVYTRVPGVVGGATYVASVWYRSVSGPPGSVAVVQGGSTLQDVRLGNSRHWEFKSFMFTPAQRPGELNLYLYANSYGSNAATEFADARISRIQPAQHGSTTFLVGTALTTKRIASDARGPMLTPLVSSGNLLRDGSFEQGEDAWTGAIDAGPPPGASIIHGSLHRAIRIRGGVAGTHALRLISTGDRAAVFQVISSWSSSVFYRLSFAYRHERGGNASVAVVTPSGAAASVALSPVEHWRRYTTIVRVPDHAGPVSVYLYSDSRGDLSINDFDAVTLRRLSGSAAVAVSWGPKPSLPKLTRVPLTVNRVSPTDFTATVHARSGDYFFVLRQNFDPGWSASARASRIGSHFVADGYANGWLIHARHGDTITFTYRPQQLVGFARIVSEVAAVIAILAATLLGLRYRSRRRHAITRSVVTSAEDTP